MAADEGRTVAAALVASSTRAPDYVSRLREHIEAYRDTPSSWGSHDCVAWAISCVAVCRDLQQLPETIGLRHRSLSGAVREMRRRGCRTPQEGAAWLLGPPKHISLARYGDIVALDTRSRDMDGGGGELGMSLGVCYGRVSFFAGDEGLVDIPTLECNEAYNG